MRHADARDALIHVKNAISTPDKKQNPFIFLKGSVNHVRFDNAFTETTGSYAYNGANPAKFSAAVGFECDLAGPENDRHYNNSNCCAFARRTA